MAQLAIKGHADRGEEVIKILELLGGKNSNHNIGKYINRLYFINDNGYIESTNNLLKYLHSTVLTLEEVEALMPYKIGDKVLHEDEMYEITGMKWHKYFEKIVYDAKGENSTLSIFDPDKFTPIMKQENTYTTMRPKVNIDGALCYKIPKGYETFSVQDDIIILKPIKPQYPRTFRECCDVVNASSNVALVYCKFNGQTYSYDIDNLQIYENLRKLKICRDAYWKIAGNWEEKRKNKAMHFVIYSTLLGEVVKDKMPNCIANYLLDFPTAEMRDAFYDNFKDLIEECKELL